MPKRTDIRKILIIGSGPIVIGQACEFDYSGTQACKALRREGYQVVLVNSNPATIMTDPEMAYRTYVEPLTADIVKQIIRRERPDALLPTVGGQTGLNLAVELAESGFLNQFGVELIGARLQAMLLAEDRLRFKRTMIDAGLDVPRSDLVSSVEEAREVADRLGYPLIVRPSFTLGGGGGGVVYSADELVPAVEQGLLESPVHQVLLEESVLGWKEFELEVMRDRADNFVVVCSIENFDPMGVHTGDSITIAPAQTLTDKEYQRLRDQARRVISAVGVETGGSNIQFAVHPETGRVVVIEMNPRVSRSSALASKATGFPIAKIAALLAVGYTLDEIPNDITRETPASFEPVIDYVVVKVPRWVMEKFPGVNRTLTTHMKSVGEVMSIGRTFKEALLKALRSLEQDQLGLDTLGESLSAEERLRQLATPTPERIFQIGDALREGIPIEEIAGVTKIDPWFLDQMQQIIEMERRLAGHTLETLPADLLREAKRYGFSDAAIAGVLNTPGAQSDGAPSVGAQLNCAPTPDDGPIPNGIPAPDGDPIPNGAPSPADVARRREALGILPVYHRVDTCAAEFEAHTPYLYSTYDGVEDEADPTDRPKVIILGAGPNRIGQGIEFDYCCCHAAFALQEMGYEAIMVNCNPETVSTDYDTSDRLYFEPLTLEDVLNIVNVESARERISESVDRQSSETGDRTFTHSPIRPFADSLRGVIVQFGGQTPLKLALDLQAAGVPIWGTSPEAIDLAEDRERFEALLHRLGIPRPANGTAMSLPEAKRIAREIGYPVLVRPSYVLGGRAMVIVYDEEGLEQYWSEAVRASPDHPVLIDHYLEDAYEVDVDAVADGERVVIGGIMQHIEEAGVHSGDSACVLPPYIIPPHHLETIREYTRRLGLALGVVGLMNVQYAIKEGIVYVLEVNPRASRTVPFVSKATGVPLAKIATQVMAGHTLEELGFTEEPKPPGVFIKEAVLPFNRLPPADALLGPEMKSTGEVMGASDGFGRAFAKAEWGAGQRLPVEGGTLLVTVNDNDKGAVVKIARDYAQLGFRLMATRGTAQALSRAGLEVETVLKASEGSPNVVDLIYDGQIDLILNTPLGRVGFSDGRQIRVAATARGVPLITTLSGAAAAVRAIRAVREERVGVKSLQEYHGIEARKVTEKPARPAPAIVRRKRKEPIMEQKIKKAVLAYSGGLDTSVIVPWLRENYDCEVVAFCSNLGQGDEELEGLREKALASGASQVYVEDMREEFITQYIIPTMQAGAIYERKYLLGTSFARPLIAKRQVEIAELEGADAVAHGCTGKGNDQVRFELTYKALNPKLKVIAPWREWDIRSREDALAYAKAHNIPVAATEKKIYSRDRNLWHLSHEGGILEDPWEEPEEDMYLLTVSPEEAPDEPEYVEIEFVAGVPKKINGVAHGPISLMEHLNELGARHGIGRIDMVENRLVGMKSRGVYETPGGTILYTAHRELESLCLDRETMHYKDQVALRYAELVYYGQWFTPLREALDAFVQVTQRNVTGTVRLKLYKGNCVPVGRKAPYTLYREDYASFGQMDVYDQHDAEGFINLFGLPQKVKALVDIEGFGESEYRAPDYSKFKRD
jgi:carbamoyl-phosphate synthase large subunit